MENNNSSYIDFQKGIDFSAISINKIKKYISTKPLLTYEETLWYFRTDPKRQNTEKIISANLSLVFSIAVKLFSYHKNISNGGEKTLDVSFVDLFQAGVIGLHLAIEKYDSTRKTKFQTYAYPWISSEIRKEIRKTIYPLKTYQYTNIQKVENEKDECLTFTSKFTPCALNSLLNDIKIILSEKQYKIFYMYFVNQLSLKKISKKLNRGISTIHYHVNKIKKILQKELKK